MKFRYTAGMILLVFCVALGAGLRSKASYRDFNQEEAPLEHFMVGLIDDEFLEMQLKQMEPKLDSSPLIAAVQCEAPFYYRFSCVTQKVRISHVFKGNEWSEGDVMEVARDGSALFTDEEGQVQGKPSINMGFVNEMIPGKQYLIFLDRKLNTSDGTVIYIQSDQFVLAPILCYDEIKNTPCESVDESGNFADYKSVKNNEFFIMTEAAGQRLSQFKQKLLQKYKRG